MFWSRNFLRLDIFNHHTVYNLKEELFFKIDILMDESRIIL